MTRTYDFFDILKNDINGMIDVRSSFLKDDIGSYFEDLLLDPDFDQIGALEPGSNEFNMYKELNALPK